MPTLGDMKDRIAADMVRDDLLDGGATEALLLSHIQASVRHYEKRAWWFLATTATVNTTASQSYITRPATMGQITRVSIPSLSVELAPVTLEEIEAEDEPTAQVGQPCVYAEGEAGSVLRLFPTPSAVYAVKITGSKKLAALTSDSDTNAWTNEGFDLIVAHTKMTYYRSVLRDEKGAQMALGEEDDARTVLMSENIGRMVNCVPAGW